jgi:hypothetical protein
MAESTKWEMQLNKELRQALEARQNGNEGRARVCARRAAGLVIGEYFRRRNISVRSSSAYDHLGVLQKLPDAPPEAKRLAGHFLQRVDAEYHLPFEIDLIDEAFRLRTILLD